MGRKGTDFRECERWGRACPQHGGCNGDRLSVHAGQKKTVPGWQQILLGLGTMGTKARVQPSLASGVPGVGVTQEGAVRPSLGARRPGSPRPGEEGILPQQDGGTHVQAVSSQSPKEGDPAGVIQALLLECLDPDSGSWLEVGHSLLEQLTPSTAAHLLFWAPALGALGQAPDS